MKYINWINPHAIEITENNVDRILYHIPISREDLNELLKDSRENAMPYYIEAHRRPEDGLGIWTSYSQVEFSIEFNIGSFKDRFKNNFERI